MALTNINCVVDKALHMKTHIPYLDGWRGLAILFLLIGHFFPVPGVNFGSVGVALFFVLSGFLMSKILFIDKVPLGIFYRRRFARILPSVIVFLAVVVLACLATGREISTYELLSAATFTNNYFVTSERWVMPIGHIWSLSVEEHAYILLSLVALYCRTRKSSALAELGTIAAAAALIAVGYWLAFGKNAVPGLWLHTEVAAFGIMVSGFLLLAFRARRPAPPPLTVPLLLALGMCAYWWRVIPPATLILGCGAFALALNLLAQAPGWLHRFLEMRALRQLGVWSYSLYLWQQPFYMLCRHEGMPAELALGYSLAVGIAAFYLVENPARLWLNRVLAERIRIPPKEDDVPMPQP
jgi:peptidoglycan/LPS O-acetylase OafA/YrhL